MRRGGQRRGGRGSAASMRRAGLGTSHAGAARPWSQRRSGSRGELVVAAVAHVARKRGATRSPACASRPAWGWRRALAPSAGGRIEFLLLKFRIAPSVPHAPDRKDRRGRGWGVMWPKGVGFPQDFPTHPPKLGDPQARPPGLAGVLCQEPAIGAWPLPAAGPSRGAGPPGRCCVQLLGWSPRAGGEGAGRAHPDGGDRSWGRGGRAGGLWQWAPPRAAPT